MSDYFYASEYDREARVKYEFLWSHDGATVTRSERGKKDINIVHPQDDTKVTLTHKGRVESLKKYADRPSHNNQAELDAYYNAMALWQLLQASQYPYDVEKAAKLEEYFAKLRYLMNE